MAKITTSCKSGDTRFTRLNLLGWALLCPYAHELIWHGSAPLQPPYYPTADESKELHERLKKVVAEAVDSLSRVRIVSAEHEYEHEVGIYRGDIGVCARSKADLVYTLQANNKLVTLYVEISSIRINAAKPWQALLRGIALYYERRLPVGVIIVTPERIMYKLVEGGDQKKILSRLLKSGESFKPNPNLCSLCELTDRCPFKAS